MNQTFYYSPRYAPLGLEKESHSLSYYLVEIKSQSCLQRLVQRPDEF